MGNCSYTVVGSIPVSKEEKQLYASFYGKSPDITGHVQLIQWKSLAFSKRWGERKKMPSEILLSAVWKPQALACAVMH
jgi:hypothetical protein